MIKLTDKLPYLYKEKKRIRGKYLMSIKAMIENVVPKINGKLLQPITTSTGLKQ